VPLAESLTASITDPSASGAYPIAAYWYVAVHEQATDLAKSNGLAAFLSWVVHAGQQQAAALHYVPLPPATVALVEKRLEALRSGASQ
jgi:phosphate transport system substrate-binding protein